MTDLLPQLISAWQAISYLEIVSVAFGLAYLILAASENQWCWPCAFIGTATAIVLFWDASLLMESALNVFYLVMAIFGWWQWQYGGKQQSALEISSWSVKHHFIAISTVIILTIIAGNALQSNTNAAYPFVDSFTTWGAVITTWMVTRKILENWLYWIVVDGVGVWLFIQRELYLYALLFLIYLVIVVIGYFKWRKQYHAKQLQH